jgi:hypothetical protein
MLRSISPMRDWRKGKQNHGLRPIVPAVVHVSPPFPADLAEVADRWESLPPEIRAEVLRLIRQSEGARSESRQPASPSPSDRLAVCPCHATAAVEP